MILQWYLDTTKNSNDLGRVNVGKMIYGIGGRFAWQNDENFDTKQGQWKGTRLRFLATQVGIHVNSPKGVYDASRKDRQKKV